MLLRVLNKLLPTAAAGNIDLPLTLRHPQGGPALGTPVKFMGLALGPALLQAVAPGQVGIIFAAPLSKLFGKGPVVGVDQHAEGQPVKQRIESGHGDEAAYQQRNQGSLGQHPGKFIHSVPAGEKCGNFVFHDGFLSSLPTNPVCAHYTGGSIDPT